ncbi:beta-lactamase family protein [Chitinophagaceae bacterium LB-8]|uniref:Beta-lactamase family protein n=1 Tax=Paraflavisolibacter caeni TaxID=2982496 RepID=A0A9X3BER8_9BACT|nr:serine hydrolase [Paraflavisolibacter caeni]MCU7547524.1 beta-lactamase family protein [Paraflavisolibacter caeni]
MRWILSFVFLCSFSSCYVFRAYKVRKFELDDHERLPSVVIHKPKSSTPFTDAASLPAYTDLKIFLDTSLKNSRTAAFLVIRNDSIIYEHYFNGFKRESLLPSFSVAKSFVGTLIGIALDEGKIRSTNEPITNYLPELLKRDEAFANITIQHLMDMRSGIQFREGYYNLKDDAIKLGFRHNILKHTLRLNIEQEPGKQFQYRSVNTQLLALILQRATGEKISNYLEDKLWQPLGAEFNATWNVDSKKRKQEIAFAGLNATARDFAKLGQLYIQSGSWQGKKIANEDMVATVANKDSMELYKGYKNQWWGRYNSRFFDDSLEAASYKQQTAYSSSVRKVNGRYRVGYRSGAFSAQGVFNQVIYVNPINNVVIVRLGQFWRHPALSADQFIYALGTRL